MKKILTSVYLALLSIPIFSGKVLATSFEDFLPDVFNAMQSGPSMQNVRPNGFGALKDLDFLMQKDVNKLKLNLEYQDKNIAIKTNPFDVVFTVNNKNSIGETEYTYDDVNESYQKGGKSKSYTTKQDKYHIINNHILNGLGDKYEHITYIPNNQVIYKGYTQQADLKQIAAKQVEADLSGFYAIKYSNKNQPKEDIKNLTFEDLFKDKPLSKVEEFRLWKKFQKATEKGKDAIKSFKKENKLEIVNLEFLFEKYMEDKQVIANKMKLLTVDERFELKQKYEQIQGDDEKELKFIEQHDLFGALPGIFDFKDKVELDIIEDNWL